MRRGARVDESTCLESMRPGNGTVGSNPTLSANRACSCGGSSALIVIDAARCISRGSVNRKTEVKKSQNALCLHICIGKVRIGAGPCAIEPCEPRQVRKEATVSSQFCVPQDHLAPLFRGVFRKTSLVKRPNHGRDMFHV